MRERSPRSDRDLGIRTAGKLRVDALSGIGDNRAHAKDYEPTPFGVLEDMLLDLPIARERFTFVDLGSGKGRMLCVAAGLGFRAALGVESSPHLHSIACANIAALPARWRRSKRVVSMNVDAEAFAFPPEPLVVYLFNPFEAPVLGRVLDRLQRSLEETPREAYVLYYMPVHEDVMHRAHWLERVAAAKDWTIDRAKSVSTC
jgi:hypothetical protein